MHSVHAISPGVCTCLLAITLALSQMGCPNVVLAASTPAQTRAAFQTFTLPNGLRVMLSEDHAAPTYSICVAYNVGSRDELPGRTGWAHLFEYMMFQGSENVGKRERSVLVINHGGSANGTTNADRTNYFETLPANQLELGIFLEADRMRSLQVTQANFDNQRQVIQEERRQNYNNQTYGKTREAVIETAYDNFAYQHSTIGTMEDLNAATLDDTRAFFRTYYAPNNAVLALVGGLPDRYGSGTDQHVFWRYSVVATTSGAGHDGTGTSARAPQDDSRRFCTNTADRGRSVRMYAPR